MSGINPEAYEAWFKKPVGRYADRAEKRLIVRSRHHIVDLVRGAEVLRILKPSGQFVIGFLNRRTPWGILRQVRGLLGNLDWRKARIWGINGPR
jgi:hypothetical protein